MGANLFLHTWKDLFVLEGGEGQALGFFDKAFDTDVYTVASISLDFNKVLSRHPGRQDQTYPIYQHQYQESRHDSGQRRVHLE